MKTVSINTYKNFLNELKIEVEDQGWTTERDFETSGLREIIFKSPNDTVVGFKEHSNGTSYFNILLNYATSYDATKSFFQQPGSVFNFPESSSTSTDIAPVLNLHNNTMNIFLFVNDNRIIVVVNALSRYVSLYAGKYLRYGTELQIPNNLFIGASNNSSSQDTILNSSNLNSFMFFKSNGNTPSVFKNEISENIKLISTATSDIFPFTTTSNLSNVNFKSADGSNCLTPAILFSNYALGELDGVFALGSTFGITAENELTIDGINYKVFLNIQNSTNSTDFFAIEI